MLEKRCSHCQKSLPVQVHACWHCGAAIPGRFVTERIPVPQKKTTFLSRLKPERKAA